MDRGSDQGQLRPPAPFRCPVPAAASLCAVVHDEMLEALAGGIESRLVTGTMVTILQDLAGSLIEQPYCARLPRDANASPIPGRGRGRAGVVARRFPAGETPRDT